MSENRQKKYVFAAQRRASERPEEADLSSLITRPNTICLCLCAIPSADREAPWLMQALCHPCPIPSLSHCRCVRKVPPRVCRGQIPSLVLWHQPSCLITKAFQNPTLLGHLNPCHPSAVFKQSRAASQPRSRGAQSSQSQVTPVSAH